MTSWDPGQYLRFEDHRLRPAIELLARVGNDHPRTVVDLGCGTGNTTALLAERWPAAEVSGVDASDRMLAKAGNDHPSLGWYHDDIATWQPDRPVDVIYSNAALHWLDHHHELLPRLISHLSPEGSLAVQMPANFGEPSHTLIAETVADGEWRTVLEPLLRPPPVASATWYLRLLEPLTTHLDIWTTTYLQVLRGDHAVAEWTRGTALRPFLDALPPDDAAAFFAAYAARTETAYPPATDGRTVFPFTRLFIVAARRA